MTIYEALENAVPPSEILDDGILDTPEEYNVPAEESDALYSNLARVAKRSFSAKFLKKRDATYWEKGDHSGARFA